MGFTPTEVDAMSFEEFDACLIGHNKAHGGKRSPKNLTEAQIDEAEKLLEEVEARNAARLRNGNGR